MNDGLLISPAFWIGFGLFVVIARGLEGLLAGRGRLVLFCVASFAFLGAFTGLGAVELGALFAGLSLVYVAARSALGPWQDRRPAFSRLLMVLGAVTVVWALGKIGRSLDLTHLGGLFFLGASFLMVKIWTFCKDLYDGRIPRPGFWTFLAYCTFFPCFVSGPMHEYGEFEAAVERPEPLDAEALVDGAFRILHGLVKVLIVALALRPYSLEALVDRGWSEVSPAGLLLRSVVYSLVIYLDFSGYSDIAIAAGSLIGVRVPENFRWPYLARNLREFWQRWHITFTRVLTQYLFVPFVRSLQRRFAGLSATATATLAYLTTFAICGFWHGSTPNFLVWGLFHGSGLAVYDVFRRRRMAAIRARRIPAGEPPLWGRALGAFATFLFVSVGWTFFTLPLSFWVR